MCIRDSYYIYYCCFVVVVCVVVAFVVVVLMFNMFAILFHNPPVLTTQGPTVRLQPTSNQLPRGRERTDVTA